VLPDLIVAFSTDKEYNKLRDIAPTVGQNENATWQVNTPQVAVGWVCRCRPWLTAGVRTSG
jgi:ABC-type Fe3+-hydroxamate transport system substrate-binding protein